MKTLATLLAALLVAVVPLAAQQTGQAGQQQAEPPKTEEKKPAEPATPAGKWNMVTSTSQGTLASTLEIKLDARKVTGTLSSERGTSSIEGEFAEGKLEFGLTMQVNGEAFTIWFSGAMKEDGALAGTMDYGQGNVPWTATRVKEKF
jgi:hypothetical protein